MKADEINHQQKSSMAWEFLDEELFTYSRKNTVHFFCVRCWRIKIQKSSYDLDQTIVLFIAVLTFGRFKVLSGRPHCCWKITPL